MMICLLASAATASANAVYAYEQALGLKHAVEVVVFGSIDIAILSLLL